MWEWEVHLQHWSVSGQRRHSIGCRLRHAHTEDLQPPVRGNRDDRRSFRCRALPFLWNARPERLADLDLVTGSPSPVRSRFPQNALRAKCKQQHKQKSDFYFFVFLWTRTQPNIRDVAKKSKKGFKHPANLSCMDFKKISTHQAIYHWNKLEFVILRWNITCLRGSRRSYTHKRSFLQECRLHWQVKTFCPYLSSFSPSLSLSLSLSLSVSLCLSLSSLSLSLELSVGLTMYQFVRYRGDLCRLFSLFCIWNVFLLLKQDQ